MHFVDFSNQGRFCLILFLDVLLVFELHDVVSSIIVTIL